MARLETLVLDPGAGPGAARPADRLHADPRHGRRHHQADAGAARVHFRRRAGAGSVRRALSDGEIAQPGKRRGAQARRSSWRRNATPISSSRPIRIATGWAWRCGAADGEMELLTGNQIGSLIAYYRAKTLFDQGVLTPQNAARGVIIKTFVTTDLQKAIAEKYGLRCVETLTGFKYIGAKLDKYERACRCRAGEDYRDLPKRKRAGCALRTRPFTFLAAKKATATAGRISCGTRMATARRSCSAKSRPTRNRAA